MKSVVVLVGLLFGQFAFASAPPAGYPVVNGVVRRIDAATEKISIKHDRIPNLGMGAMTMTFAVVNPQELSGLSVGDDIRFVADEIDGQLAALWIESVQP